MALNSREKEIEGSLYKVGQLPVDRALKLKHRIFKIAGPTLKSVGDAFGEGAADLGSLGDAVMKLTETSSGDDFVEMVNELLHNASRDGKDLAGKKWTIAFGGEMMVLYKVVMFAIEVNFGDFFDAGRSLIARLAAKMSSESKSPSISATAG